jgi:hypothetical protein
VIVNHVPGAVVLTKTEENMKERIEDALRPHHGGRQLAKNFMGLECKRHEMALSLPSH